MARLAHMLNMSPASATHVQTAITLLPDEPRWYALAAKIAMAGGDKATAINFLEQAIHLEPRNVDHHLALGQLYLNYAENTNVAEALHATKYLEHACRLAPEHPKPGCCLARATSRYRQSGTSCSSGRTINNPGPGYRCFPPHPG